MAAWQDHYNADDVKGLLQIANKRVAMRPRDPMLFAVREIAASCDPSITVENLNTLAKDCVAGLSLVPPQTIYDNYRINVLWTAIGIEDQAFGKELAGRSWGNSTQ